jgi:hypothetical protein
LIVTTYPPFIAGLFDSPWVVIAILVASGIANWLAQRRAQKAEENSTTDSETPQAATPGWQEKLRELLEEAQTQSQPRPTPPAGGPPPLLRRTTPPEVVIVPPVIPPGETYTATALRPPPVAIAAPRDTDYRDLKGLSSKAARPVLAPAQVEIRPRSHLQEVLRHPDTARQAFVASLVFGPPKGLES